MNSENRLQNVSISGSGSLNGGEYDKVSISGSGKILGNVEANLIKISGSGLIEGNVRTVDLTVSGSTKIMGSIKGETISNSGSMVIEDGVQALKLTNSGSMRIRESVTVGSILTRGSFSVDDDVDADEFDAKGAIKIKDALTANKVRIEINGKCYAEKIQGEEIEVWLSPFTIFTAIIQFFIQLFSGKSNLNRLSVESLQGTRVQVEYVDAKTIRGEDVVIGPHSEVELVEYSNSIKIDSRAKVKNTVKL